MRREAPLKDPHYEEAWRILERALHRTRQHLRGVPPEGRHVNPHELAGLLLEIQNLRIRLRQKPKIIVRKRDGGDGQRRS